MSRRIGWVMLLVFMFFLRTAVAQAPDMFVAVQSGRWEDPATWGYMAPPEPGVTIPGPENTVDIPPGITVIVTGPDVAVKALIVESGALLRAQPGSTVSFFVQEDILNGGTILGPSGSALSPAGGLLLKSARGNIRNYGRIRGGDAGPAGGPGGYVELRAVEGSVENWGLIEGGAGGENFPDGWVGLSARDMVRHRGEARGGDVFVTASSVDVAGGRVIGAQTDGDVVVRGQQAILAGSRATRVSGAGAFLIVGDDALLDVQDVEVMGFLARERGLWMVGGAGARLYLTGNRARFAPFHALGGTAHIWFDPTRRFLDADLYLSDLFAATLDEGPSRPLTLPQVVLRRWQAGRPGETMEWAVDVMNLGNGGGDVTLAIQDELGWLSSAGVMTLSSLEPGGSSRITITLNVPLTATVSTTNTLTLRASSGEESPASVLRLPIRVTPRLVHFPVLTHRGEPGATSLPPVQSASPPQVSLTWPGAEQGAPVQGRSLLAVVVSPPQDVVAVDLAYWDGTRWVPIATTVDMENFTEDGVWMAVWDTARVPLSSTLIQARAWRRTGAMGATIRNVRIEHAPVAVASAQFQGSTVTLDATASSDLEGVIASYQWELGDGTVADGPIVVHTYAPGQYVVRLTVTDGAGLQDEAVYVLDTVQQTWQVQEACGCASAQLRTAGPSFLPLPWGGEGPQSLGVDAEPLASGRMLRVNMGVEATLVPGSNPLACRIEQSARGTWTVQEGGDMVTRAWQWAGQSFAGEGTSEWGLVGYTQPFSLLEARDGIVRWVMGLGWGWRPQNWGLPVDAFSDGARVDMEYRARIKGTLGSCTCTWQVSITPGEDGQVQVSISGGCP